MKLFFIKLLTLLLFFSACAADKEIQNKNIEVSGILEKQGMTTYQYGTHTIQNYALKSSTLDLDNFTDQKVKIKGERVEGYPLEGGPILLEVIAIENEQ